MTFLSSGFLITLGLFFFFLFLFSLWGTFIDAMINGIRNQKKQTTRIVKNASQEIGADRAINEMITSDSITKMG